MLKSEKWTHIKCSIKMGPSCVLHSPNIYIIALILPIIIISCIALLQGISTAMVLFYPNNSVEDKRQVKERWELLWSPFYRGTNRVPERGDLPEVTQWVGWWSWPLGGCPALGRVLTGPEYWWYAAPRVSCATYPGSPSLGRAEVT